MVFEGPQQESAGLRLRHVVIARREAPPVIARAVGPKQSPTRGYGTILLMGLFRVPARLTGPTGRSEQVELLVDSDATLLVVPRDLANRLGVVPTRQQPVETAGGKRKVWPVAEVQLNLNGRVVTTPCFIAPSGPPLLGSVALESLFLTIDPVAKRLVPVEGFVG